MDRGRTREGRSAFRASKHNRSGVRPPSRGVELDVDEAKSLGLPPLFLAFDELEGLRDDRDLTAAWGNVVRYLFSYAPNMLIVTCVFPKLWREWFEPLTQSDHNVKSLTERVAGNVVELEAFSAKYGLGLIPGCMAESFARRGLPSNIYPFEPADIEEIGRRATTTAPTRSA